MADTTVKQRLDEVHAMQHDKAIDELEHCIVTILNFATNAEGSQLYASEVLTVAIRAAVTYMGDEEFLIRSIKEATGLQMK